MAAEGSTTPARGRKRASNVVLSDTSEEEDHPTPSKPPAGKKKRTTKVLPTTSSAAANSDEDELNSDEEVERETPVKRSRSEAPAANGKGKGKGKGRASAAANGGDDEDGSGDDGAGSGDDFEGAPGGGTMRPEFQRGEDGYVSGSVVRMKLVNFMTYDHVEFRPGPNLNMILGPNGTGKSSIAAGIALGLGFGTQVMGRIDNLKSYVKQGCEVASIEVEIKGRPGQPNPIIYRRFDKEKNGSAFKLNNKPATQRDIKALVASFGIQAGNLCSFLPQDKVADFAKLDPKRVLIETMRAAGDSRLSNWFTELCELGKERHGMENTLEETKAERDTVQNQVNLLAPDVAHFLEREDLQKQEKVLACLVIAAERYTLVTALAEAKQQKADLKREMGKRLSRSQPIKDLQDTYKKKVEAIRKRCDTADKTLKDFEKETRTSWKRISTKEDAVGNFEDQLGRIKQIVKREEKAKADIQARIRQAQAVLDQPVEDMAAQQTELQQSRKTLWTEMQQAKKDFEDVGGRYGEMQNKMSTWMTEIDNRIKQHERLSSIQKQKEDAARSVGGGSMNYILNWLEKHGDEFEKPVCKPPMISVHVNDRRYASQVEAGTNFGQRQTFIVQTRNDYNRLLELGRHSFPPWQRRNRDGRTQHMPGGKVQLYLSQVHVDETSLNPHKPCNKETLNGLGFEGWASDFVEAEAPVIAFLNERCGLSRLAVTTRNGDRIDADACERAGVSRYVTSSEITTIGRSRYGRKDTFMRTDRLRPAQAFNIAVDTEGLQKLNDEMTDLKRRRRDAEGPLDELRQATDAAREKGKELKGQMVEIDAGLKEISEKNTGRRKAALTKSQAEADLKHVKTTDVAAKTAELKAKIQANLEERLAIIAEAQTQQERYLAFGQAICARRLELMQVTADLKAIEQKKKESSGDMEELEEEIGKCTRKIQAANANKLQLDNLFKERLRALGDDTNSVTERLHEVEPPLHDRTLPPAVSAEELDADLREVRVKLQLSVGVDRSVVDRHRRLVEKLEVLVANADEQTKKAEKGRKRINAILEDFDPALEELIKIVDEKFSGAFLRIGCHGEVKLDRVEGNYEDWGINILVSYRTDDALQILSGSRQSGGERSLATVTYLMSLASMSRTPFSLVDEVNQGMDQRAERGVHNQLVGVTCDQDAGQYFLITPKLLTDLRYHKKMKILNVNNGIWLPAPDGPDSKWPDFKGCLKKYRAAKRITA